MRKREYRPYLSDLLQDTSVSAPVVAAACNHARNSKAEKGKLPISQARFLIAQRIIFQVQSTAAALILRLAIQK